MPGQHIVQGSSDLWVESGAQAERSLNTGWTLDQYINSTGGLTSNGSPSTATAFLSTGDGTTGSGNGFYALGRRLRVVHTGGTFYGAVGNASLAGGQTTITVAMPEGGTTSLSTTAITSAAVGPLYPAGVLPNHFEPIFESPYRLWVVSSCPESVDTNKRSVAGTGTVAVANYGVNLDTGATAGSAARKWCAIDGGLTASDISDFRYAKFRMMNLSSSSGNTTMYLGVFENPIGTFGSTIRGYSFLYDTSTATTWYGFISDGTAVTTVNLAVNAALNTMFDLSMKFDGTTVRWFINGSAVGSSTGNLPSGTAVNYDAATIYLDNKSSTGVKTIYYMTMAAAFQP